MKTLAKRQERLRRLAERIAEDLFTAERTVAKGKRKDKTVTVALRVQRLVLAFPIRPLKRVEPANEVQDGSGYSEEAVASLIYRHLCRSLRKEAKP